MNVRTHIPGYPRIGKNRELKRIIEHYWKGGIDRGELIEAADGLKKDRLSAQSGLDLITVGDFSLYDHILDLSMLMGNIPARFRSITFENTEDLMFAMARGVRRSESDIHACEMRKWFDTNYHYIVPEFKPDRGFSLNTELLRKHFNCDGVSGTKKAVVCGPVTYLWLGKKTGNDGFSRLELLPSLLKEYGALLAELKCLGYQWIQLDEPAAILDYLPTAWKHAYKNAYEYLSGIPENARPKILFTTYFASPLPVANLLKKIRADGFHFDTGKIQTGKDIRRFVKLIQTYPENTVLSLGVIPGRNVWKMDTQKTVAFVREIAAERKGETWISASCSLLHVPVSLEGELSLPAEIKDRLSFADEKIGELIEIKGKLQQTQTWPLRRQFYSRQPRTPQVPAYRRRGSFEKRSALQRARLGLPLFPTTTIGSFPQTQALRKIRRDLRSGALGKDAYDEEIRSYIKSAVQTQEEIDLDVLVHGEPERNDMVEYFSSFLNGFVSTENGWVQSYGTRCVKPPIIHGDISRSMPMTLKWASFAASLSKKPVKGMLTGPVTLVKWSFPREDLPIEEQYYQAARAVAEEVRDLDAAGIPIIQIDEAAFKEAQPLPRREWKRYGRVASLAFRICSSTASDATQIHTHMCYSDFSTILDAVRDMDADVLTIETSRSEMELIGRFAKKRGFHHFGPGVYDIHSPAVPTEDLLKQRIQQAADALGPDRVWINPDCGLKTRGWPETEASLRNMVRAAKTLRTQIAKGGGR